MWTMLRSQACWDNYQKETAKAAGVAGLPIDWKSGPKEYPALVTTYMPPVPLGAQPKMVSAYVYPADAEKLLAARPEAEKTWTPGPEVRPPSQDDFNRWATAYLLALTRELREIGALKPDRFEASLMESLQLVDETATARRDEIMRTLAKADHDVLDRLRPQA